MKKITIFVFLMILITGIYADPLKDRLENIGIYVFDEPRDIVDFELEDLNGNKHKLSDYKGQVVFLNFWASWCGPCRSEMPSMQELKEKYGEKGLTILAVNLQEPAKTAADFMKMNKLDFTVLLDTDGTVGSIYGTRSIPTTYIINRNSKVVGGVVGARIWAGADVENAFNQLLSQ